MKKIRLANAADATQIAAIYTPFCTHSNVSFELEAPSADEMAQRISKGTQLYPWLVCENDGRVDGYVYASAHRERAAYRWVVDVTAYIGDGKRGQGIGRALYTTLFALLRHQGFYQAYAGITLPNDASVGLHEAMGFQAVSVYRNIGYKAGAWLDVGRWSLTLRSPQIEPAEPLGIMSIIGSAEWDEAIAAGEKLLQE